MTFKVKFEQWIMKDMLADKDLNVENLSIIYRGDMMEIWNYVFDHVKSSRIIDKINGNLLLISKSKNAHKVTKEVPNVIDQELENLKFKKVHLQEKLFIISNDINLVEKNLKNVSEDVIKFESKEKNVMQKLKENSIKAVTLSTILKSSQDKTKLIEELSKELNTSMKFIKSNDMNESSNENKITTSSRDFANMIISEKCSKIKNLLNGILTNKKQDTDENNDLEKSIFKELDKLLDVYSINNLIANVCSNINEAHKQLSHEIVSIDEGFISLSLRNNNSYDLLNPIELLQKENQLSFMEKYVSIKKATTIFRELDKKNKEKLVQLFKLITEKYANEIIDINLTRSYIKNKIYLSEYEAKKNKYVDIIENLKKEIESSKEKSMVLASDQNQIKSNSQLIESNKIDIESLVRQNMNVIDTLHNLSKYSKDFVRKQLREEIEKLLNAIYLSNDQIKLELNMYLNLVSRHYCNSINILNVDNYSKKQSYLNERLNNLYFKDNVQMKLIYEALQCPNYMAFDQIFKYAFNLIIQRNELRCWLQKNSHNLGDINKNLAIINDLADLKKKSEEQDQNNLCYLLPHIIQYTQLAEKSIVYCKKLNNISNDWWEQPAKSCVPWLKVDGLTIQEWISQWKLISHQIISNQNK